MKKIISILLVVSLILTVSACKPGVEGESSSISSRSSESNETQSMNSEITSVTESIPEKEVVPIMEATEEDVLQFENIEESTKAKNEILNGIGEEDVNSWASMVDNTTDIAELAATQPIDVEKTWILYYGECDTSPNRVFFHLNDINTGRSVCFVRELNIKYYDEILQSNIINGYTVYKSEMGGYWYMFLQHLIDKDEIKIKNFIYVTHRMSSSDFSSLAVGDSISKVAEIDPVAYFVKRNSGLSVVSDCTYHLCTNGLLEIQYNVGNEDITIQKMQLYTDYIKPNTMAGQDADIQNSMEWRYDFTILPQDYPPV